MLPEELANHPTPRLPNEANRPRNILQTKTLWKSATDFLVDNSSSIGSVAKRTQFRNEANLLGSVTTRLPNKPNFIHNTLILKMLCKTIPKPTQHFT